MSLLTSLPKLRVAAALVLVATAGLALPARAVDVTAHGYVTTAPIDEYRNGTQKELVNCASAVQATLGRDAPPRSADRGCTAMGQHLCGAKLHAALQALRKPAAREALEAYHAAFVTALSGIAPQGGEPRDEYERRQQVLHHLMTHAWMRFELAE